MHKLPPLLEVLEEEETGTIIASITSGTSATRANLGQLHRHHH